jgi:hypothetical protein
MGHPAERINTDDTDWADQERMDGKSKGNFALRASFRTTVSSEHCDRGDGRHRFAPATDEAVCCDGCKLVRPVACEKLKWGRE